MRILIDARLYGLEHAGLGRYTKNLVDELSRLDKKNNYVVVLRDKYFNQLKLPKNWRKVRCDTRQYTLGEQFWLAKIIYGEKPDLVHSPHYNIAVFSKAPVVVTIHDLLMGKNRGLASTTLPPVEYFLKFLASRFVLAAAIYRSKRIIVPSDFIKDEIIDKFRVNPSKISVIYEGATLLRVNSKFRAPRSKYFAYVGNAYPHKNLDLLIRAITVLQCTVVIATSRGVFEDRLKKLVRKYNARKYVKLLGFVPDKDLGALYKNAIGFVYPSVYEGFGLQGLEVMGAGGLLLASDIPVFKEIYSDHALYFDPADLDSLTEAMRKAVNMSSKERVKRITASQKFVNHYSWPKMAKQTLGVYNSLISSHKH